jgi:hypothetical protein
MNGEDRKQPGAMGEEGFTSLTGAVLDSARPPKPVRRMAESIQRAAGRAPEITRPGAARWQVALAGRRVAVTVDFTTSLGGKAKWAGSVLTVDGKRRPLAAGPAEFGRLWHKLEDRPQRPGLMPVQPVPAGAAGPPLDVRIICDRLSAAFAGQDDVTLETGYQAGAWTVGVTLAPDTGLRLVFTRHGSTWGLHGLQVMRDGRDLSAKAGKDIAAAIALLAPPPAGTPSRGARDTGVETRKRVVIREYRRAGRRPGCSCLREPGAAP